MARCRVPRPMKACFHHPITQWFWHETGTYFPVFFDFIYERVRSKLITLFLIALFIDQLYLAALLGTPTCRSVYAQLYGKNSTANGTAGQNSLLSMNTLSFMPFSPISPGDIHTSSSSPYFRESSALPVLTNGSNSGDSGADVSIFFDMSVFDLSDPVILARWVAVPLAAIANARYQSSWWLAPAGVAVTAFVGVVGELEVPKCVSLASLAVTLQEQQARDARTATKSDGNSTSFELVLPISLFAAQVWTVVSQRLLLWVISIFCAIALWRLFLLYHGKQILSFGHRVGHGDLSDFRGAWRQFRHLLCCGPCYDRAARLRLGASVSSAAILSRQTSLPPESEATGATTSANPLAKSAPTGGVPHNRHATLGSMLSGVEYVDDVSSAVTEDVTADPTATAQADGRGRTSAEHSAGSRCCSNSWSALYGLGVNICAKIEAVPQRVQVGLVLSTLVIFLVTITVTAQFGTLAAWTSTLLNRLDVLQSFAKDIADQLDPSGTTGSLLDTVFQYTQLGVEALDATVKSIIAGSILSCVVCVYQMGTAVATYSSLDEEYASETQAEESSKVILWGDKEGTGSATPQQVTNPLNVGSKSTRPCDQRCGTCCTAVWGWLATNLAFLGEWTQPYGIKEDGKLDFGAFSFYTAMSYIPFFIVNMVLAYFLLYLIFAIVLFVVLFEPLRDFILVKLVSTAVIATILAFLLRKVLFNVCLSDSRRIMRPRCFMFFDLIYSTTVGIVSGFISAVSRVILGGIWSALRCIRLHEPLLPGPAALLDSGWLMHGALLKCKYASGDPPKVKG